MVGDKSRGNWKPAGDALVIVPPSEVVRQHNAQLKRREHEMAQRNEVRKDALKPRLISRKVIDAAGYVIEDKPYTRPAGAKRFLALRRASEITKTQPRRIEA